MAQSKRYITAGAQLKKLGRHYLHFSKKISGDYSERHLSAGAAFTVFAHGEIESFIEDWAVAILERAEDRWKAGKFSRPLANLLSFRTQESTPAQVPGKDIWSAPCVQAFSGHRNVIDRNHGIREQHICSLYIPLGFDIRNVDTILISDMNTLGTIRGSHAHQSYKKHLGQQFDPFERQTKVNNIYKLLSDFDKQLLSYLKSV